MIELQDLRILIALAHYGNAVAAGKRLDMAHTTVLRAVAAIEATIGYAIFVRTPDGAIPTPEGRELLEAAGAVEQAIHAAGRRFATLDDAVAGTVRLATNLPLAELLVPGLTRLRATAPALGVDLLINQRSVDLTRNDADLSVRHLRDDAHRDHPVLVARSLGSAAIAMFGAADYIERGGTDVIGYTGHEWPGTPLATDACAITTNSTHVALAAVAAGLGLCALPCYLGRLRGLVQVGLPTHSSDICVLVARDMENVPRIRAVIEAVASVVADAVIRVEDTASYRHDRR